MLGPIRRRATVFFTASEVVALCDHDSATSIDTLIGTRVWVPANQAINSISTYVSAGGTLAEGCMNGFAVYTGGCVFVGSTVSNNNLWSSTGWRTGTFASAIAAQSTGRFVYVCSLVVGYSAPPTVLWHDLENEALAGPTLATSNKRSFYNGGGTTSFPASFNPATIGTTNSFIPLFGLA